MDARALTNLLTTLIVLGLVAFTLAIFAVELSHAVEQWTSSVEALGGIGVRQQPLR